MLRWFDGGGAQVAEHEVWLSADRMLSVDSSSPPVALPVAADGGDALLSIELFADVDPIVSDEVRHRLYGLIDWYGETGDIVTLHSDHCVLLEPQTLTLTDRPAAVGVQRSAAGLPDRRRVAGRCMEADGDQLDGRVADALVAPRHDPRLGAAVGHHTVIVENHAGERISAQHTLAPWATAWTSLDLVVPGATQLLGGANGLLLVESESDLAMVCFTRHRASGRWSAEHLMSASTPSPDGMIWPAGC